MTESWPVVRTYTGEQLAHIKMPVGGIGTGCISFGGRGQLVDWELFNRPAKGFNPDSFFAINVRSADAGELTVTRALELTLTTPEFEGPSGSPSPMHGLPRFRDGEFAAAYPLGQVSMTDPDVPVTVRVQAYNPLIPNDADASGIPALIYRARTENTSGVALDVSVCGNLQNVVGHTAGATLPSGNVFERSDDDGITTLLGRSTQVAEDAEAWGTVGLSVVGDRPSSHRLTWAKRSWGDSLLEYWDDFSDDGQLCEPEVGATVPIGSLVLCKRIEPGASEDFLFIITWHFPNRRAWNQQGGYSEITVGNHYCARFTDAADV